MSAEAACSVEATDVRETFSVASGRLGVELDFLLVNTEEFAVKIGPPVRVVSRAQGPRAPENNYIYLYIFYIYYLLFSFNRMKAS